MVVTAHKGRAKEHVYKHILEDQGFYVIRSAGSHDPWDLVATKDERIVFVQVKCVDLPVNPPKELLDFHNCPKRTELRYIQYCYGQTKPVEHHWTRGGSVRLESCLKILQPTLVV